MEILPQFTQNDVSVAPFVTELLRCAIQKQASDMHVEPYLAGYRIRYRRQGMLMPADSFPFAFGLRVLARLKVLAELDIAERRLPQDGRFTFDTDQPMDCRVSTCPTRHGEKMVVRFFRQSACALTLDALFLEPNQADQIWRALTQ